MSKYDEDTTYLDVDPLYDQEGNELALIVLQELIRQNKIEKGFNTTDPLYEFAFLSGEFGELAQAIKDPDFEDLDEALVDIIIFVLGFFAMYEVDSAQVIAKKIKLNLETETSQSLNQYPIRKDRLKEKSGLDLAFSLENQLAFAEIVEKIIQTKKLKNYNLDPKQVEQEFVLMTEELAELLDAIKAEESIKIYSALADIFIYALGHLEIRKKPSYELITKKIAHNSNRKYEVTSEASYQKIK